MSTGKDEIHKLADHLPDTAPGDNVMYEIYVRQRIAEGEIAIVEGAPLPHAEVKKLFTPA